MNPRAIGRAPNSCSISGGILGVSLVLGCNGLIWVAPDVSTASDPGGGVPTPADVGDTAQSVDMKVREALCRTTNAIRCLADLKLAVYPSAILDVIKARPSQQPYSPLLHQPRLEIWW